MNREEADFTEFATYLEQLFPDKKEEQRENVIKVVTTNPAYYSNPRALAIVLRSKMGVPMDQAFIFAGQLVPYLRKQVNYNHFQNADTGAMNMGGVGDGLLSQYINIMAARELFGDKKVKKEENENKGFDIEKVMQYSILNKMFGGDSSSGMDNQTIMILNSLENKIKSLEEKLENKKEEKESESNVKFITVPDEEGNPKRIPVYSESEILTQLMMMGNKDDSSEKAFNIMQTVVDKALDNRNNQNNENIKDFYDKIIEQQDKRIEDIKESKKGEGSLENFTNFLEKLQPYGLNLGTQNADDRIKVLEKEMDFWKTKFNMWNKIDERKSRDEMLKALTGKIGEGISKFGDKYGEDIKDGVKKFFGDKEKKQ